MRDGDLIRTSSGIYLVVVVQERDGTMKRQAVDLELGFCAVDDWVAGTTREPFANIIDILKECK